MQRCTCVKGMLRALALLSMADNLAENLMLHALGLLPKPASLNCSVHA